MADKTMSPTEQLEYLRKLAGYYSEKGEDALADDIMKSVQEERAAGRLNDEMIITMTNNISRFLNPEQKKKLNDMLNKIIREKE